MSKAIHGELWDLNGYTKDRDTVSFIGLGRGGERTDSQRADRKRILRRKAGQQSYLVLQTEAIKSLNPEDICITTIASEKYVVHYTNKLVLGAVFTLAYAERRLFESFFCVPSSSLKFY